MKIKQFFVDGQYINKDNKPIKCSAKNCRKKANWLITDGKYYNKFYCFSHEEDIRLD